MRLSPFALGLIFMFGPIAAQAANSKPTLAVQCVSRIRFQDQASVTHVVQGPSVLAPYDGTTMSIAKVPGYSMEFFAVDSGDGKHASLIVDGFLRPNPASTSQIDGLIGADESIGTVQSSGVYPAGESGHVCNINVVAIKCAKDLKTAEAKMYLAFRQAEASSLPLGCTIAQ